MENYIGKVSPPAITAYVYLKTIAIDGEVVISSRKLAEALQRSRNLVWGYLEELEKAGMIEREKRENDEGGKTSNRYRLLV